MAVLLRHAAIMIEKLCFFFVEGQLGIDTDVGIAEKIVDICAEVTGNP